MRELAISDKLSEMIPQRDGQGAPSKFILRAIKSMLLNIVWHSMAVEPASVP
jgi:hypothetical protein